MLSELYGLNVKIEYFLAKSAWPAELTAEVAAFVLLLCFIGLSNLENRFPKIKHSIKQNRESYRANIGLFLFNSVLMSLCSVSALFVIAERFSGYGLLNHVDNALVKAVVAFLSIDLMLYGWHVLCHKYDTLWLLHRVHHNDPYLNVSTAFRLHFVEILLTNLLKALVIIAMGIDKMLILAIETVITLGIMFHHTNIGFEGERMLSRLFIVPFIHRLHHSVERAQHDTNYGAVLSVWDRIFKTLSDEQPIAIGIKGDSPRDVIGLLKFGFGIAPAPAPAIPVNIDAMIAEAAYYRAQQRNFNPGNDLGDWYEAKTAIMQQLSAAKQPKKHWLDGICSGFNRRFQTKHVWQFNC